MTVLPTSLFAAQATRLGLRAIEGAPPLGATEIAMCWHERTHADPAAKAFRALVQRVVLSAQPAPSKRPRSRVLR